MKLNLIIFILIFCVQNYRCDDEEEVDLNLQAFEKQEAFIEDQNSVAKTIAQLDTKSVIGLLKKRDQAQFAAEAANEKDGGILGSLKNFQSMLTTSCWKDIGCFASSEYNGSKNTVPLLPMSPDAINPVFHMYTLEHRSIPRNFSYNATAAQFRYSTFNASLRTAFITHGFQSGYSLWIENTKDLVMYKGDDQFNVVVVIWEKGARQNYNLAATNCRVVGALIGYFINSLCETFNITPDKFWLIGHSLGAHVMGFAGKRIIVPMKIGRITALDPAGISYHSKHNALRLHHSDAQIVDVIHMDAALWYTDGFGSSDTLGHIDFYPNGGGWQTGCQQSQSVSNRLGSVTSGEDITCSHTRACLLMNNLDKPGDDCHAMSYQCDSYETFLEGRCATCQDNKCQPMGLNPDYWFNKKMEDMTIDKKYYVNTASKEEYCLYHYQMGFHITNTSDSTTGILGIAMNATITTIQSGSVVIETKELNFSRIMTKTIQRKVHTSLVTFEYKLDKIHSLAIEWSRYNEVIGKKRFNRGFALEIPIVEIYFMSHVDQAVRDKSSGVFCPKDGPQTRITVNRPRILYKPCNPKLKIKSRDLPIGELKPLTFKEDIHSVDYMKQYNVWHKIKQSMFKPN